MAGVCSVAFTAVAVAGTTGASFTAVTLVDRVTAVSLKRVWPPCAATLTSAPAVTAPPELSIRWALRAGAAPLKLAAGAKRRLVPAARTRALASL